MVLTRRGSQMISNATMATTRASTTCSTDTTTTVSLTTFTNPSGSVPTVMTTSAAGNPICTTSPTHDLSISSESADQTVISPIFNSITAQTVRREVREGIDGLQQVVEASVGLCQARFMREVDDKIQKAFSEIKQLLTNQPAVIQESVPATSATQVDNILPPQPASAQPIVAQPPVCSRASVLAPVSIYGQSCSAPIPVAQPQNYIQPPPLVPAPYQVPREQNFSSRATNGEQSVPSIQTPYNQTYAFQPQNPYPQQLIQQPFQQNVVPPQAQVPPPNIVQPAYNYQQSYNNSQQNYPQDAWSAPGCQQQPGQPQNYNLAMSLPNQRESVTKFKLAEWGVRFDGTSKTMNVQEFIFRVGALRRDFKCTDIELLRNFHILLDGPALDWYWDYRKIVHVNTWEELEKALLEQYRRFEKEHQNH